MSIEKEPVEIFAGSIWEAELLNSMLLNEGITGFVFNEAGTIFPFENTENGTAAAKIMVVDADVTAAKSIVDTYRANNFNPLE